MNPDLEELAQLRDAALRDLVELEDQVGRGEISGADAEELRGRYSGEAFAAIALLEEKREGEVPDPARDVTTSADEERPSRWRLGALLNGRRMLYAAGLAAAVAAGLSLSGNLLDRPSGGLVSGNLTDQTPPAAAPSAAAGPAMDLRKVTDAQMEAVVAANPEVVGMRLALASRYLEKGRFDLAVVHYTKALEQEPRNPEALAHLGWVMLKVDQPEEAARLVDLALEVDPDMVDAMWIQANVRLYGLKDPEAALMSLKPLQGRTDLNATVRGQVADLSEEARRTLREAR